jgi:hypothetical protein
MGNVVSTYMQPNEVDHIYESTSSLMTERVLRLMYPDEIDANPFPDAGNPLLPPELCDLYPVPSLLMQGRKNVVKAFLQRKMSDPRTFWQHFCKTLDIEMNPKPTVVIRVDKDGMIHTECQNGDAEIKIEFDESDDEVESSSDIPSPSNKFEKKEIDRDEDNIEVPKKNKTSKKDKKEELFEPSGQEMTDDLEHDGLGDLDGEFDVMPKKKGKKKTNN